MMSVFTDISPPSDYDLFDTFLKSRPSEDMSDVLREFIYKSTDTSDEYFLKHLDYKPSDIGDEDIGLDALVDTFEGTPLRPRNINEINKALSEDTFATPVSPAMSIPFSIDTTEGKAGDDLYDLDDVPLIGLEYRMERLGLKLIKGARPTNSNTVKMREDFYREQLRNFYTNNRIYDTALLSFKSSKAMNKDKPQISFEEIKERHRKHLMGFLQYRTDIPLAERDVFKYYTPRERPMISGKTAAAKAIKTTSAAVSTPAIDDIRTAFSKATTLEDFQAISRQINPKITPETPITNPKSIDARIRRYKRDIKKYIEGF